MSYDLNDVCAQVTKLPLFVTDFPAKCLFVPDNYFGQVPYGAESQGLYSQHLIFSVTYELSINIRL